MELEYLLALVVDEEGNLGLTILDDELSEMEVIGMLEWCKDQILAGIRKEDDPPPQGGPGMFVSWN